MKVASFILFCQHVSERENAVNSPITEHPDYIYQKTKDQLRLVSMG